MDIFDKLRAKFGKTAVLETAPSKREQIQAELDTLQERRIQLEVQQLDSWEAILEIEPRADFNAVSGDQKIELALAVQKYVFTKAMLSQTNQLIRMFQYELLKHPVFLTK